MRKYVKHLNHYLPLIVVLVAGLVGFYVFSYDQIIQMIITAAVAAAYITWGMVHHHLHGDLDLKIVMEYFLVGLLGFTIVISLL